MNITVILIYLVIQFFIQLAMYSFIKKYVFKSSDLLIAYCNISLESAIKYLTIAMFVINIAISMFVKLFTASGGLTGMSNLGASVLLGVLMTIHVKWYKIQAKRALSMWR